MSQFLEKIKVKLTEHCFGELCNIYDSETYNFEMSSYLLQIFKNHALTCKYVSTSAQNII